MTHFAHCEEHSYIMPLNSYHKRNAIAGYLPTRSLIISLNMQHRPLSRPHAPLLLDLCALFPQFTNHGLYTLCSAKDIEFPNSRPLTASASGLTPFSINDTQRDSVLRSRSVFCGPRYQLTRLGAEGGGHTSSREISERMSITSRAAWRLDASSTLGILLGNGSGACGVWRDVLYK